VTHKVPVFAQKYNYYFKLSMDRILYILSTTKGSK